MPEDAAFNEMLSTLARDFLTPLPEFIVCFSREDALIQTGGYFSFPGVHRAAFT